MPYILFGSLAFLLFTIYDVNSVTGNRRLFRGGFFLGCFLLAAATAGLISSALADTILYTGRIVIFAVFMASAVIFLLLLIYTLFFALPFGDTYISSDKRPETCTTGFYALSRHPGVLWFAGFYFSLWLALPAPLLLLAAVLFSFLNLLYIVLQDRWILIRTLAGYDDYKKTTPFLIPNRQSLTRCVRTFRRAASEAAVKP